MKREDLKIGKYYVNESGYGGELVGFDEDGDPEIKPNGLSDNELYFNGCGIYGHSMPYFLKHYTEDDTKSN